MHYRVIGSGPPVLFIQGVGIHGDGWLPQISELSARYRCLSFDNRGMGESQPAGAPLSVAQMAADAQALMDAEGWESAHLVGHSLGGPIALQVALSSPGRVRSLSLLCTFARGAVATRLSPAMLWIGTRTRIGPARSRRRAFLELVMPREALAKEDPNALAERLVPLFGHDLADQPPIVMKQLSALRAYDATPRLKELGGIPTIVASAAHDIIAPPSAGKALAEGISGATFIEYPDASHGLPIQHAARINALLDEHFRNAEGRAQSARNS